MRALTEDEAKKRMCCGPPVIAIMTATVAAAGAGITAQKDTFNCIASECMAWRWNLSPSDIEVARNTGSEKWAATAVPNGSCGLAGRP